MEVTLKIGAKVRVRSVPAHATLQIGASLRANMPTVPQVGYKSAAGHTEMKEAPHDSPEWAEYARKVNEIAAQIEKMQNDFATDYAVEAWQWPGEPWHTMPPPDWQFPETLKKYGIAETDRRLDYIRYELLRLNADVGTVFDIALGRTAPVTNAEVDAAMAGFPVEQARLDLA